MPAPASPDDPRRAELLRQRELVARHLAWLDSEIARDTPVALAPPAPVFYPPSLAPAPAPYAPAPEPSAPVDVAALLPESTGLSARDKYGCIVALIVLALLILGVLFGLPYLLPQYR